jgi:hypothetical protein
MSRVKLVKTINGQRIKYDNDFMVIYHDREWNEYIVKNKAEPKYDSDGIEFGLFVTDLEEAIDYFNSETIRLMKAYIEGSI